MHVTRSRRSRFSPTACLGIGVWGDPPLPVTRLSDRDALQVLACSPSKGLGCERGAPHLPVMQFSDR